MRIRSLGVVPGVLPTGRLNAITDVPGVLVGQTTLIGDGVNTGVTAILPPGFGVAPPRVEVEPGVEAGVGLPGVEAGVGLPGVGDGLRGIEPGVGVHGAEDGLRGIGAADELEVEVVPPRAGPGIGVGFAAEPGGGLPAAVAVGNGYGKLVGSTQVDELGVLETPILLTGTLSVFRVADALLTWLLERDPSATSLNPVVGETNDGYLSDIRSRPITPAHVFAALDTASADLPAEGNVGAGTGTVALGFKAGIGTSSRLVAGGVVGVLVQANFSGTLTVLGTPIEPPVETPVPDGNSCVIVVATDLAVDARQLGRVARRAVFALGRVGSDFSPGSGDYAIAFSTSKAAPIREYDLKGVFNACMEAVEEALLNSLTMASTVTGFGGNTQYAVPHELITGRAQPLPRPGV